MIVRTKINGSKIRLCRNRQVDLKQKRVIIITGANSGIGKATAKAFVEKGDHVIIICRNKSAGEETERELNEEGPSSAKLMTADLSDLKSVAAVAERILLENRAIDALINNAGYQPPEIEYIDGIEKSWLASHLGHMLLTLKLKPALLNSTEARVINVSSALHSQGRVSRFFTRTENLTPGQAYGDDKLANILFTLALNQQWSPEIAAFSLHPGVVRTHFADHVKGMFKVLIMLFYPFFLSPRQGAATSVYLADEPLASLRPHGGKYFVKKQPAAFNNADITKTNADWLWKKSLEFLDAYL